MFLHVDMDAFFASVEQRDHPELRGKPVIVGALPTERGVVSTCSYEARKFGVHSAMPSREAGRLCPHGIFMHGNYKKYSAVSHQVFSIFERYTPLVEPVSIDEAFLDVSGATLLFGPPEKIAESIRADIRKEVGLTASAGVAPNMFLAKLASDLHKPDGLTVVPEDQEGIQAFLDPLPVKRIWGVGGSTAARLASFGCHTVRDLREMSENVLVSCLGSTVYAAHLKRLSRGEDDRQLEMEWQEKSISREHTYPTNEPSRAVLEATLRDIADDVGRRVRADGRRATIGKLKIRWGDFRTVTRQRPFELPSVDDLTFREMALALLDDVYDGRPIRLIGFGVTGLQEGTEKAETVPTAEVASARQMLLFDDPAEPPPPDPVAHDKRENLCQALDAIREKLGTDSVRLGSP